MRLIRPSTLSLQLLLVMGFPVVAAEEFKPPLLPPGVYVKGAEPRVEGGGSCEPTTPAELSEKPVLRLLKITPSAGTEVTRSTAVVASLQYEVPNYVEGQYHLLAQFEIATVNYTASGAFPEKRFPYACGSAGIFTVYFPLQYIWDAPAYRRPLTMVFLLLKENQIVAFAGKYEFPVSKR
jgi:hypothetical protein